MLRMAWERALAQSRSGDGDGSGCGRSHEAVVWYGGGNYDLFCNAELKKICVHGDGVLTIYVVCWLMMLNNKLIIIITMSYVPSWVWFVVIVKAHGLARGFVFHC